MGSPVMHWQILTKQPERLQAFYTTLFGWRMSGDNPLGYQMADTGSGEGINGGIWPSRRTKATAWSSSSSAWTTSRRR